MATLGTPTKDGEKWYQRWYPVEGDIRPDGLEMLCKVNGSGSAWEPVPVLAPISGERAYRILSEYIPPSGWYCVGDDEVLVHGDVYSDDMRAVSVYLGKTVLPNGGWVLRREPQEQPCKSSESVTSAVEAENPSSGLGHGEEVSPDSSSNATSVAAPVAWQFRREPVARKVDHYRLLEASEIVNSDDQWWSNATSQWLSFGEACWGQPIPDTGSPACRPVYAPLPIRLEDVPDGRCFTVTGDENQYWKSGTQLGSWNPVDGCVDSPTERELRTHTIKITDYVAELGEVK